MTTAEEFLRATLPALDLVHNLARRLVPTRADAEDLVQETYLRAWQTWTAGRPPRRVEPWLATICLNLGRDRARRAATRLEVIAEDLADHPAPTDVEAEAIHRVQRMQVERALWALPESQRRAATRDRAGLGPPWPQGAGPSGPRAGGRPPWAMTRSGRPPRTWAVSLAAA